MRVLIAEDDANIRDGLAEILSAEGYETECAADGNEALACYSARPPDLVCLDVMMPEKSGYDVCREIRQHDPAIPILFISAKSEEIDKVLGLELGADDFIQKPFGVREVIARIRAVTRRALAARPAEPAHSSFAMGDLEIRPAELRAHRGKETIDLSLRDVRILALLYERRGQALDRIEIFQACWGLRHIAQSRTLDQHISQLRKRIEEDPRQPRIIRTVHGVGYRYDG